MVWADDLAVPLLAAQNAEMEDEIRKAFVAVFNVFHQYGMTLNMSKGKTEVMVTYAGPEARVHREQLRREPHIQVAMKLQGEPMQLALTRIFLLETLVFTKLLYGCGSWSGLTCADMRRLTVCYVGLLRRPLGQVKTHTKEVLTDQAILQKTGCASLSVRLAQQRFLLAARLARFAPSFLHEELLLEEGAMDRSWRGEIVEDLNWLGALMDLSSWGTSLSTPWETWKQGKPGWQHVLRTAVRKHGYVTQLVHPRITDRGDEDDTLQDLWLQVQCRCHCGRGFATRKADIHGGVHTWIYLPSLPTPLLDTQSSSHTLRYIYIYICVKNGQKQCVCCLAEGVWDPGRGTGGSSCRSLHLSDGSKTGGDRFALWPQSVWC